MDEIKTVAVESARSGATQALSLFRDKLTVEQKTNKTDLVTEADRKTQQVIIEELTEQMPTATIIAEEQSGTEDIPESGPAWVIDPIDGTNNYVRGNRLWTTSLAYLEDAVPRVAVTIAPALGDEYVGTNPPNERAQAKLNGEPITVSSQDDSEQLPVSPLIWWSFDRRDEYAALTEGILRRFADIRRVGSAQLTLARVAAGDLGGAITNITAPPWDTVAGVSLVTWAGGTATDIHAAPWHPTSDGLVVSNGAVHDELLAVGQQIKTVALE